MKNSVKRTRGAKQATGDCNTPPAKLFSARTFALGVAISVGLWILIGALGVLLWMAFE